MDKFYGSSKKKYLTIKERVKLIKDIQSGLYLVKDKRGKVIEKKTNKFLMKSCDIIDVLNSLSEFNLLGEGSYGTAYSVCTPKDICEVNKYDPRTLKYSIKEIKFNDIPTYNRILENPDRNENVEIRMLQFLASFVTQKATPHINLPIMSWVCIPSPHLGKELDNEEVPRRYIVSEIADYGDLYGFIALNYKKWNRKPLVWKTIFFQILHTLAVIHRYFPNFLHNDLKPNNILVRSTRSIPFTKLDDVMNEEDITDYFQYEFGEKVFYIPDFGFQLLLWDFDFSCIAGKIDNDKVLLMISEEDANLTVHKNRYYDIAMCFGWFKKYFGDHIPDDLYDWMNDEILPYYIHTSYVDERVLENTEFTTPEKLLHTNIFDVFTKRPDLNRYDIKEKYTGKIVKSFSFDAPKNLRYTLPNVCKYGDYTYLMPKNISIENRKRLLYRIKCKTSTDQNSMPSLDEDKYEEIEKWIEYVMSQNEISENLSDDEINKISKSSLILFKDFEKRYFLSPDTLHAVVASSMMYSSYVHLSSYEYPFNRYGWWMRLYMIDHLEKDVFIDTYKQFTRFIAEYIE